MPEKGTDKKKSSETASYTPGSILAEHFRNPVRRGLPDTVRSGHEVFNRKCGDRLSFALEHGCEGSLFFRFEGKGCFYCLASASVACDFLSGLDKKRALEHIEAVRRWLAGARQDPGDLASESTGVMALGEVRSFPMRIGCADMAWKGLAELIMRN